MGGECGLCGGDEEVYRGFWWGNLRDRDHLEDLRWEKNIKMVLQDLG